MNPNQQPPMFVQPGMVPPNYNQYQVMPAVLVSPAPVNGAMANPQVPNYQPPMNQPYNIPQSNGFQQSPQHFNNQFPQQIPPQMPPQMMGQQVPQFNPQQPGAMPAPLPGQNYFQANQQVQPVVNQMPNMSNRHGPILQTLPQQKNLQLLHSVRGKGIDIFDPQQFYTQEEQEKYQIAAVQLRTAMKGMGTDEQAIINVISSYNWAQRVQIAKAYTSCTGFDLEKHLHQETSFSFRKLVKGAFKDRYHYWAKRINEAIDRSFTDNKRLIELIMLMDDSEYVLVNRTYKQIYGIDLYEHLGQKLGNKDWNRLLRAWMKGQNIVQHDPAQAAQALYTAAKGAGTDEDKFIQILTSSTHETYRAINEAFYKQYKKELRTVIEKEFSFNSKYAFTLCHDFLLDPKTAVASMLKKATKGIGTDKESIILLTVLFGDYMKGNAIVEAYKPYGDLEKDLKHDLKGWFEKGILAMWGL